MRGSRAALLAAACCVLARSARGQDDDVSPDLLVFELDEPLRLDCAAREPDADVSAYRWSRDGAALAGSDAAWSAPAATESDAGLYRCIVNDAVQRAWQAVARAKAVLPAAVAVAEGDRVALTCGVRAPGAEQRVRWSRSPPGGNGTARWTASEARGVADARLELAAARAEDAGEYRCAPEGGREARVLLRVTPARRRAWLPFLLCCAEAAALCALLLLWERRAAAGDGDGVRSN